MSSSRSESFHARKARLRASFLAQLPERLGLAREMASVIGTGIAEEDQLGALERFFHTLKGSSASFGFPAIAELAAQADEALKQSLARSGPTQPALVALLREILDRLSDPRLTTPDERAPGGENASDQSLGGWESPGAQQWAPGSPAESCSEADVATRPGAENGGGERSDKLIYLCDDDKGLAEQLSGQLACFGYQVMPFSTIDTLVEAVSLRSPAALIMDVLFPEGVHAGPEALETIFEQTAVRLPCIFISGYDTFEARLKAVKVGGGAYCTKPVRITEMVELLDRLTRREPPAPFHVLVIDDDPDVADWHALVLEEAGMVTRSATCPGEVLGLLDGFNADLVLMDMYMPECSGPELARVLRQVPGYVSLPIIYVSSETDIMRQFEAMEVGADGFLTKPVDPARLVTEVSLRAERMRALHALMVRDGLTGLFNHNTIMQFLDIGLADARREGRPMCFAMIDVDRFKRVNDSYGHPAGDQVLVALSRGLRLRLRESDLVGRYGGEEFAVVLGGIDAQQAREILDEIREAFKDVVFYVGDEKFRCSFSGGIAAFPQFPSAERLTEAADLALYRAKRGGRDRIEVATLADRGEHVR